MARTKVEISMTEQLDWEPLLVPPTAVCEDYDMGDEEEEEEEKPHEIHREKGGHFKKGYSANPNGKGKNSVSLVKTLQRALRDDPTIADRVIIQLIDMSLAKGNLPAIKELFDRIDGKPTERHKVEGALPIKLVFVPADENTSRTPQDEREGEEDPKDD